MIIILDPGHGLSNKKAGVFDPGAVSNDIREADIVMDWANELRSILIDKGHKVIRTRVDHSDPAPVGKRAGIARQYKGDIMISLHCNAANGEASGTETFYRGSTKKTKAEDINNAVVSVLSTKNRGAKTEASSQHKSLAVMDFQPTFLLEIGFIDNASDRSKMLNPDLRHKACLKLAEALI